MAVPESENSGLARKAGGSENLWVEMLESGLFGGRKVFCFGDLRDHDGGRSQRVARWVSSSREVEPTVDGVNGNHVEMGPELLEAQENEVVSEHGQQDMGSVASGTGAASVGAPGVECLGAGRTGNARVRMVS